MLDSAEFRLDDGAWEPALELLRLDTALRGRLGWPLRMEALAQPWATEPWNGAPRRLSLRFTVSSEVSVAAPRLALEGAEMVTVSWNGEAVPAVPGPWWVDECLSTLALPPFGPGEHHLELRLPYTPQTNVEWCYLLGDFGVSVAGAWGTLTSPVRALSFGDWTRQGLPFYAGNVTYHCSLRATGGPVQLELLQVKAALVTAVLDGGEEQALAFAPQRLDLGTPAAGPHSLNLTAYGNRVNAFGAVHLSDARWRWFGPNAWRTVGVQWADEYQLKPMGLLTAPRLLRPEQTGQPVNLIAPPLIHSTET